MKNILRQEIEVWYIIPVIRKELSRIIVKERGFSQHKTAIMLLLTEGAISQYLNGKRGNSVKFKKSIISEIEISADKIIADKNCIVVELNRILDLKECKYLTDSFLK